MDKYIIVTTLCNEVAEISSHEIVNADSEFLKWIDDSTK